MERDGEKRRDEGEQGVTRYSTHLFPHNKSGQHTQLVHRHSACRNHQQLSDMT